MKKQARNMNILMTGVGGQGIVLASDILCLAAVHAGCDAKKSEIHGMSQRGGSVFSHVRFGKKVFSPIIAAGSADILASLEESETLRWLAYAGASSTVIMVKKRVPLAGTAVYPEGTEAFLRKHYPGLLVLDPAAMIPSAVNAACLNVALVGAIAPLTDINPRCFERAIRELAPAGTGDMNMLAFEAGRNAARDITL